MGPKRKPVYNCTHCEYTSSIPSNVRGHVTRVHKITNPKIHECHFCGEMFSNLHKLNFHMGATYCANTNEDFARELEEKAEKRKVNFYCLECNYQSYLSYNVISHMLNVHKIKDPKIHVCKCGEMYQRASELKEHTSTCDEADEDFRGEPPPTKVKTLKTRFPVRSKNFSKKKKLMNAKVTMANLVKMPTKTVKLPTKSVSKVKNTARDRNSGVKLSNTKKDNIKITLTSSKPHRSSATRSKSEVSEEKRIENQLENKNYYHCDQCDYHSAFKSNIRAHVVQVHKKRRTEPSHKCYQCKRVFPNSVKLRSHKRDGECKIVESNNSLKRQVRKPAKLDRLFHCLECDYQSPYTCHVRTHMKLKHNVSEPKIHQCEFCLEMFPTIIILKKHMGETFCVNTNPDFARQVREAEENKCYYNCLKCDYLSAYKHHIRNHMRVIHKIPNPTFYSCENCGETFGKEGLVAAHMKTCSGQNAKDARRKTKVPNQIYVCEKCGVVFDNKDHFEGHKEFTNCKKRRKIIRKGEIFGETELPANATVQNLGNQEISPKNSRKSVNMKFTGKNPGKRLAVAVSGKRSRQIIRNRNTFRYKDLDEEENVDQTQFVALPAKKKREPLPVPLDVIDEGPFKCSQCPSLFGSKDLLNNHVRLQHAVVANSKWNTNCGNKANDLESISCEIVKMEETEMDALSVDVELEPKIEEETNEQEHLLLDEKPVLTNQYLNIPPEEHLDGNGYSSSHILAIEATGGIEIEEPIIAIETTEVEGPSTDSENYYIFDDLSSTYVTESQNFIVAGIDGAVYDGELEIGEGFNIDPSSSATDSVFYQLQFCDGANESVVLLEDPEFINANINDNEDLMRVEFRPSNNNVDNNEHLSKPKPVSM